jgi:hypothetical protein
MRRPEPVLEIVMTVERDKSCRFDRPAQRAATTNLLTDVVPAIGRVDDSDAPPKPSCEGGFEYFRSESLGGGSTDQHHGWQTVRSGLAS